VLLEAIDRAEGDRAAVAAELFNTDIKGGILGDFTIDDNGDTSLGEVSFYRVDAGKPVFVKTITPDITPEGDINQ
jgi:ABC-type branched-subunit amino acid transport system substrate-binding protein